MLDTIARRMGLDYVEAESVAKDCVRRGWIEMAVESVRVKDDGRGVAAGGSP
jgi:hypothetical protein